MSPDIFVTLVINKNNRARPGRSTADPVVSPLAHFDTEGGTGGIYALGRIAKDSEKDHWPVMEVMSAYIRENAS